MKKLEQKTNQGVKVTLSSSFVPINKNIVNVKMDKYYLQALGAYCWLKANRIFTENYVVKVNNNSFLLEKDEISYSFGYLATAWGVSYKFVRKLLAYMEENHMIEKSGEIEISNGGKQYVYKVLHCDSVNSEEKVQSIEDNPLFHISDNVEEVKIKFTLEELKEKINWVLKFDEEDFLECEYNKIKKRGFNNSKGEPWNLLSFSQWMKKLLTEKAGRSFELIKKAPDYQPKSECIKNAINI